MQFNLPESEEKTLFPSMKMPVVNKSVIILQPMGLGDIIFCQGVAAHYRKGGYKVYWPVVQEYLHHLKRAYPEIEWLPEKIYVSPRLFDDVEKVKYDLLHSICAPLRWSDTFCGTEYRNVMRAKYDMYGLDWTKWIESAMWIRDIFKEDELMEITGADSGTSYNLVSEYWGTGTNVHVPVNPSNGLRRIDIKKIEGYSLFDWAKVIMNAEEIHFVSSSNIYLLEMLPVKAKQIHIYQRLPAEPHHRNYDYILRRHDGKYIFH